MGVHTAGRTSSFVFLCTVLSTDGKAALHARGCCIVLECPTFTSVGGEHIIAIRWCILVGYYLFPERGQILQYRAVEHPGIPCSASIQAGTLPSDAYLLLLQSARGSPLPPYSSIPRIYDENPIT